MSVFDFLASLCPERLCWRRQEDSPRLTGSSGVVLGRQFDAALDKLWPKSLCPVVNF